MKENEQLERDLEKVKELGGKGMIPGKMAEGVVKRYRELCICNGEAEKVESEYEKGENLIKVTAG